MTTPIKTFAFQFDVDAVPYNKDTVEIIYGRKAQFNPDYPEDVLAKEYAYELIKDAIVSVFQKKLSFLAEKKVDVEDLNADDKAYWDYLDRKENRYLKAQESLKLSKRTKN